jgi:putative PEP-CTERM system TPR-repeat lipoprotein
MMFRRLPWRRPEGERALRGWGIATLAAVGLIPAMSGIYYALYHADDEELGPARPLQPGIGAVRPAPPIEKYESPEQAVAIKRLEKAVSARPEDPGLRAELAEEYLRQRQVSAAIGEYRHALQLDPENVRATLGMSELARRMRSPRLAVDLAKKAQNQKPKDPSTLNALGAAQAQAGMHAEARRTFQQALELGPDDVITLLNAACARAMARDWKAAENFCERAIAAMPKEPAPRLLLASMYLDQGKRDKAAAQVERIARDYPTHAGVRETLGRMRIAQGRLEEAAADFREAHRLDPAWPMPALEAGMAEFRQKQYQAAEAEFRKVLEIDPQSVAARLGLAHLAELQGRPEVAIDLYEKVLVIRPQILVALNNLAFYYAEQGKNLDHALELARRASVTYPEEKHVWDTLGWVCYRAGRHDEAVTHLQKAARLTPEKGIVHYHLAKALLATGRKAEAADAFRAALQHPLSDDLRKEIDAFLAAS